MYTPLRKESLHFQCTQNTALTSKGHHHASYLHMPVSKMKKKKKEEERNAHTHTHTQQQQQHTNKTN